MTTSSHPTGGKSVEPGERQPGGQPAGASNAASGSGALTGANRPFQGNSGLSGKTQQAPAAPGAAQGNAQPALKPAMAQAQPAPQTPPQAKPAAQAGNNPPPAPNAQPPVARAQAQPIPVRPVAQPVPAQPAPRPVPANPAPPPAPPATPVRATVSVAHPRRRHWLMLGSFLLLVVLPSLFWAWYLWTRASDQYVSTVGFSVRKEESTPSIDLLGGLAPLGGGSGAADTDILYEYIRSQDMVEKIDAQLNVKAMFAREWPRDFLFAADPDDHIEDLTEYWQRQVQVLYDTTSDLITLKVSAFTPEDAQQIANAVFAESSSKINELSAIARDDTTRLTKAELEKARTELTETRQAMTAFRMKSQIVDPEADLAGQMGVLSGLQGQLAEALVAHDLLMENAQPTDHRVIQSQQKIDALRRLIDAERGKFGAEGQGPAGESYAQLMAEYEKLAVDREFAEGAYRSARVAYEAALAEAQRKSRYLAAHIEPKVAQSSTEPNRPWLLFVVIGMLLTGWSILVLVYYSIRDRQ